MKIKKGENRIVVLLPALDLALKFPRIRFWLALKWVGEIFKDPKGWPHYLGKTVHHIGIKRWLFKGIADNWNECRFCHKTKHHFLQPTHFSFFGLCNFQRYGQPVMQQKLSFWINLQEISNYEVTNDGHHFYNTANFCLEDGKLKILDYAETRTQEVILKVGLKLQADYDPNFVFVEEKKR